MFNPINIKNPYSYYYQDWIKTKVDYISGISMFSTGIILAFLRLYEPFYVFLIKRFVLNCFGIVLEMENEGV